MDLVTALAIGSVIIGFLCIGGAFAAVMYQKPKRLPITLGVLAVAFVTVIPVILAVFFAL